jgi:FHA domain
MHTPGVRRPARLVAAVLAMMLSSQASAQAGGIVRLSAPVADTFPTVRVFLDVRDDQGSRVAGLHVSDVSLTEDEATLSQVSLRETEVGVRQIIVLNTNNGLRLRDAGGRSRFDIMRDALLAWWQTAAAARVGVDDLTLIAAEGTLALHRSSTAELGARLEEFQPSFEEPSPGLDLLLATLRGPAAESNPPGQTTHLIFATGLIETPRDLPVAEAIRRANETGTSVHVVLLGPATALDLPAAASLRLLAQSTGGVFMLLEPGGSLSDLMTRITGQRTQYELTYTSPAQSSGMHSLQAQVTRDGLSMTSSRSLYTVDLQPPEVVFVSPPTQIVRQTDGGATRVEDLNPTSWPLEVLVTFPDGHARNLVRSQLLVDGRTVAETTQPPFDRFLWDLRGFSQTGTHLLAVAVEDQQGLRGVSTSTSVSVEVASLPRGLAVLQPAMAPFLLAIGLLMAGIIVVALWTSAHRRLRSLPQASTSQRVSPRPILRRARLQRIEDSHPTEAFLLWEGSSAEPIPLVGIDLTLGRDAALASVILDDPSVSALHARLIRQADGGYVLKDQGSIAGTYVNFQRILEAGQRLQHGDQVHIGRVAFRFRLADAPAPRTVSVTSAIETESRRTEPRA